MFSPYIFSDYLSNKNGPKTLPGSTYDIRFTSLLQQPSTRTCCDKLDRNCVNTDNTEPTNCHSAELIYNSLTVDPIDGCVQVNLHNPSLLSTRHCTLKCMRHTQKRITGTLHF